jgi:hypothetical protein
MDMNTTTLEERSRRRREIMITHTARSPEDAEAWDLEFWQQRTPEERLSALVAIRHDVELVEAARCARPKRER